LLLQLQVRTAQIRHLLGSKDKPSACAQSLKLRCTAQPDLQNNQTKVTNIADKDRSTTATTHTHITTEQQHGLTLLLSFPKRCCNLSV
jgi:hypothetical protein